MGCAKKWCHTRYSSLQRAVAHDRPLVGHEEQTAHDRLPPLCLAASHAVHMSDPPSAMRSFHLSRIRCLAEWVHSTLMAPSCQATYVAESSSRLGGHGYRCTIAGHRLANRSLALWTAGPDPAVTESSRVRTLSETGPKRFEPPNEVAVAGVVRCFKTSAPTQPDVVKLLAAEARRAPRTRYGFMPPDVRGSCCGLERGPQQPQRKSLAAVRGMDGSVLSVTGCLVTMRVVLAV